MKLPKRLFVSALALCMGVVAQAQQAREDFAKDITLSGAQNKAYPGPQKQLSPALEGYTPYYISHYGRHGSRYMIGKNDYDRPYDQMKKAADAGMLTDKGIEVMEKVRQIRDEAKGRDSELTPLGAQQHRDIAKRMYERFPEVFKGKTHIDAKSTTVIRCILSMENALQQLIALNPELTVTHDASAHDMYYMNFQDSALVKLRIQGERSPELWKSNMKYDNGERVVDLLFKDKNFLKENKIDGKRLVNKIFDLATSVQNTELRDKIDLFDIFNLDEVYNYWAGGNAWWYVAYGNSPLSGGNQAFSQRNLVKKIISEADSCLAFPHPGATLRFGHDQMVMPLACLLNINGYGKQMSLDELANSDWINYRIFPMACNVQFIFYHKNDNDKDVIFKVLLNEDEAVLPDLKPFKGCYYKWSDFKAYYEKL